MKEAVQEISKSTITVIIVLGVFLLLVGVADDLNITNFSLKISNPVLKTAVGIMGTVFILFGIYSVWRDGNGKQPATASRKVEDKPSSIVHVVRSETANPASRTRLAIVNSSSRTIQVIWVNYDGHEEMRKEIPPGGGVIMNILMHCIPGL